MRVALFARYSSHLQDDLSLNAQVAEMEKFAYAAERQWEIVARYSLPEVSSDQIERSPEFLQMLADARAKRFDVLLLHKLDRLGRDREVAVMVKAHLRRMGVEIRSVVENFGDGLMDRMMEGFVELFADFYRGNLAEETKKGQRQLVREGWWRGGKVPWGLALEEVEGGKRTYRRLIPDPVRGPLMVGVFEQLAAGGRLRDILAFVQEKTGEVWPPPTFYSRVRNPVYKGVLEYGKSTMPMGRKRKKTPDACTEGQWAGLVSEDLWARANGVLDQRSQDFRRNGKKAAQPYLLSQAALCAKCGAPLVGNMRNDKRYYVCSRRRTCTWKLLPAEPLEAHVLDQAQTNLVALDLEELLARYQAGLQPQQEASVREEAALRKRLTEVRTQAHNLVAVLAQGHADVKIIGQTLRKLQQEEGDLADQIGRAQVERAQALEINTHLVRLHLEEARARLREMSPEDLKLLFRHMFRLQIDLETGEGQLAVKLAPGLDSGATTSFDLTSVWRSGRGGPIGMHTHPLGVLEPWCPVGFRRFRGHLRVAHHPEPRLTSAAGCEFRLEGLDA